MLSAEAFRRYPAEKYFREPPELRLVYEALAQFMAKHGRDTNPEELEVFFLSLHPAMEPVKKEFYHAIFENLQATDVSSAVVEDLLGALSRRDGLLQLAVSAYEAAEGRGDALAVAKAASDLSQENIHSSDALTFVTDDLEQLYEKAVKENGLRWRLKSLNQALGSLRKGDFGFVFARPETGKTTFLASECSYMAGQASSPVLWFNNEEQGEKVMLRCYQAALGLPLEQLFSSMGKARKSYFDVTKGNLKLVDEARLDRRAVEAACETIKPALIVFDQIDKIVGFKADRDDLVLGAVYQWARELAKTYCPVIGVCQADGTAEGVKWLTMAHVANAKTSKQAEADWILGIGRSNDPGYEQVRHFNVSKNKLIGDKDSIPAMRHGQWDVLIEPTLARYKDIVV